jgi:pimeloyl-ACP methyl ester carboxylesterase
MSTRSPIAFPVGYQDLHPDVSLNFQLNRFWNWVGEPAMLDELRTVAPTISTYDDWTRQLLAQGEQALAGGRALAGAYLIRTAEFFMTAGDPRQDIARDTFVNEVLAAYNIGPDHHHRVPYEGRQLSAYRLAPDRPGGRIVVFGGFDSYIEEWMPILVAMCSEGLDVVAIDGPGQGAALEDGIPMTPQWHKPVAAVLDYFDLDDVTLLGFSLGGCLVMRAAAYEPRVRRVIAQDILTDFNACYTRNAPGAARVLIQQAAHLPGDVVDIVLNRRCRRHRPQPGPTPFPVGRLGYRQRPAGLRLTAPVPGPCRGAKPAHRRGSPQLTQDVLLLAGAKDHYVPLRQLGDQLSTLNNATSVTARLFTEAEHAHNHCQVGNLGLALEVILDWLDDVGGRATNPRSR